MWKQWKRVLQIIAYLVHSIVCVESQSLRLSLKQRHGYPINGVCGVCVCPKLVTARVQGLTVTGVKQPVGGHGYKEVIHNDLVIKNKTKSFCTYSVNWKCSQVPSKTGSVNQWENAKPENLEPWSLVPQLALLRNGSVPVRTLLPL